MPELACQFDICSCSKPQWKSINKHWQRSSVFLQTAFISDQCVCACVCDCCRYGACSWSRSIISQGNIQREAVDTADSTMLIFFLPYSYAGNHGYGGVHDHLMVWKSASCVFILVREACGTRGASHWAITLLLPPWGGWLKGKKKKPREWAKDDEEGVYKDRGTALFSL